jgi:ribosomal protein S18 acetylase RimI-like enzyme
MGTRRAREATADDYALFARFFGELNAPDPTPSVEWWESSCSDALFVEEDGAAVGYAFVYRLGADWGHVAHVVVDPARRGSGLGASVMRAAAERLSDAGCAKWSLYVEQDNTAAIALYRRSGMEIRHEVEETVLGWDDVSKLPKDASVNIATLEPHDDAHVEEALGMPEGRIARVRRRPNRSFMVARRGEAIVGAISFDWETSSTPILTVLGAPSARPLLEAIRDSRPPTSRDVRLLIDGDPDLAAAVRRAGGRIVRRLLRMDGTIADALR